MWQSLVCRNPGIDRKVDGLPKVNVADASFVGRLGWLPGQESGTDGRSKTCATHVCYLIPQLELK